MTTSRVSVSVGKESHGMYQLTINSRGGLAEQELITLFMQVYKSVNRAERQSGQRSGPEYQRIYEEGPVLFNAIAIDRVTGKHHNSLDGIQVSAKLLRETVDKLKALGVEVLEH